MVRLQNGSVGDERRERRGVVAVEPEPVRREGRQRRVRSVRVLRVAVPAQVHLALERLVAEPARERLVPGVLAHVCNQI